MSASRRHTREQPPRDPPPDERPSKSQRKRDAHALQALGAQLTTLRDDVLVRLPIGEALIEAVRMAREIRSHEGRRRQVQLIGKLMRDADGDAIRAALNDEGRDHRADVAVLHAAERWRERILADDRVLANWCAEFPDTRETVEPLVLRARAELAGEGPGRAYRDLFRKLRAALEGAAERSKPQ
ncbi:ribosome biogenesis factor YjgA [Zeimonas arvi]|nr:ribosome biogenesis factor YjgA [Zeimonas arvi]